MEIEDTHFALEAIQSAVAGSVTYPPGGRFGPRLQQDIQLLLLQDGEMQVTMDSHSFQAQAGQAILLSPGHEESFAFTGDKLTQYRWIAVHMKGIGESDTQFLQSLPPVLPITEEMNRLVDLMLSVKDQTPPDGPLMRSLGAAALHLYPDAALRYSEQHRNPASVDRAISWIRSHYAEEIKLGDLANEAGVTPEHLVRLFRKHDQGTPINYVWQYRTERAVDLLIHTGLSVSDVAQQCGFKTPHHFSRTLKQVTGHTPSQIRQSSWSGQRKA